MVNTINTLTERNKELLAKIEELEKGNQSLSKEKQIEVLEKIGDIAQELRERDKKDKAKIGKKMWKGKSYSLYLKKIKYHEKNRDDSSSYSKTFTDRVAYYYWSEEKKQAIQEKENPLYDYLREVIDNFAYMTGRVIHGESKLAEKVEYFEQKLRTLREEKETHFKELVEKRMENKEQSLKIEKLNQEVKHWKERAERGEEDAEIHFKALTETSKEWNEKKLEWWVGVFYKKLLNLNTVRNWTIEHNEKLHSEQTQILKEEVIEKSKEVKTANENLEKKDELIEEIRAELKEKAGEIKKVNEKCEKTEYLLYLANKPLPSLPEIEISLPKKQNKFKQFGTKIKTKFKNLIEKNKSQKQEMIARTEVKVK